MVPLSCSGRDALLFRRDNIKRHDRQHRAVHGHGNGHLAERDLVEENLHVFDGVDGHARLAHVAHHALVVGIVAAVRGQVEGYRKPLLPRRQVAPVERVRFLGRRKARVLPDGPRPQRVHGGVGAAQERRNPGGILQVLHGVEVFGGIKRLYRNMFRRQPLRAIPPAAAPAGAAPAAGRYSIFVKSGFIALFLHPQPVLPFGQRCHRVARHVHETRPRPPASIPPSAPWDSPPRSPAL